MANGRMDSSSKFGDLSFGGRKTGENSQIDWLRHPFRVEDGYNMKPDLEFWGCLGDIKGTVCDLFQEVNDTSETLCTNTLLRIINPDALHSKNPSGPLLQLENSELPSPTVQIYSLKTSLKLNSPFIPQDLHPTHPKQAKQNSKIFLWILCVLSSFTSFSLFTTSFRSRHSFRSKFPQPEPKRLVNSATSASQYSLRISEV